MKNKHIIVIDLFLVVGSLLVIAGFIGYSTPLVIAPIDGFNTTDTSVLFSFDRAEVVLIDDNIKFTSPQEIHVENNIVINLKPGVYYWKVKGALSSEVRQLTIESEIDLKLRESEKGYEVVNSGNENLEVDIYEQGRFTGNVVLNIDESKEVSGTKFVGSKLRGENG
jgi:hypothetical protein